MSLLQIHEPGQTPDPHAEDTVAIGIDLGTTHSVIAQSNQANAEVIRDAHGVATIPSVVAYAENTIVGVDAKARYAKGEANVIASIKRLMGRSAEDIEAIAGQLPYTFTEGEGPLKVKVAGAEKTAVEISGDILRHLKQVAEVQLGKEVDKAVITVPAYFDDAARTATRDAARMAGLEVLRLVNEPTAAALAYGLEHEAEGIYAIYDLGGGTFDISILKLEDEVFQVLSTAGDTQLGGDDFDRAIAEYIAQSAGKQPESEAELHQLMAVAREAKETLSDANEAEIEWAGNAHTISRDAYDKLIDEAVKRTLTICEQAMQDAQVSASDIKGVVLVGGSTRVPLVRTQVEALLGKEPLSNINPDEVVAIGAALQAEALTVGMSHLLLDVTPLSLGLETMGGIVEKVVHRNTPIPVSAQQEFTTYQDGQSAMKIHVVQGEREMVDQCRSLANFNLKNIPPLPANVARIKVKFMVDADGLLTVSAEETTTGVHQEVEVKPSYGLEIDDIEQMIRDSMENAKDDILERLLVEARVEAQRVIYDLNGAIERDGELLSVDELNMITAQKNTLEVAIAGDNRDLIDAETERLNELLNPFAQARMDKAIGSALQGTHIDEYEDTEGSEKHA